MAVVVLAQDERLGREVALKRMHPDVGPDVARRFDREAKVGASLSHPNVVKVFDVVTEGEQVTIVMEYVEGGHSGRSCGKARSSRRARSPSSARWPTPSTTRTRRASSTATSSPATCWCAPTGR